MSLVFCFVSFCDERVILDDFVGRFLVVVFLVLVGFCIEEAHKSSIMLMLCSFWNALSSLTNERSSLTSATAAVDDEAVDNAIDSVDAPFLSSIGAPFLILAHLSS